MNGTLAQQMSLVSYGNHWLKTGSLPADYYPANVAFKFGNRVDFRCLAAAAQPTETGAAPDPAAWFRLLQLQGCQRLRLWFQPSAGNQLNTPGYKLAGFVGGGGTWLLEARAGASAACWANRWEVTRPKDPDQLIWAVSYDRTIAGQRPAGFHLALASVRPALAQVLTDIQAFAAAQELANWATIFQQARATPDSPAPASGFYRINQAIMAGLNAEAA